MSGLDRVGGVPAGASRVPSGSGGPAQVIYTAAEDFGDWSHLVPEIASAVAGHLAGDRLAAWVHRAKTGRHGQAYRQSVTAWWASTSVVVEVSGTRPLASAGGKRFRPDGPWSGRAVVHALAPARVVARTWARRSAAGGAPAAEPPSRLVHDSLEVLPEPLRRLTAGGPPAQSLLWDDGPGRVTEEVMAYRVLGGSAVVLVAWRGPCRREGLDTETWHSRVVDTAVLKSVTHSFGPPVGAEEPAPNPMVSGPARPGLRPAPPSGRR